MDPRPILRLEGLSKTLEGIGSNDALGRELLSSISAATPESLRRAAERAAELVRKTSPPNMLRGALALAEILAPFHRADAFSLLEGVRLASRDSSKLFTIRTLAHLLLVHNYHLEPVNPEKPPPFVFDANATAGAVRKALYDVVFKTENVLLSSPNGYSTPLPELSTPESRTEHEIVAMYLPLLLSLREPRDEGAALQVFDFWRLNTILAALPQELTLNTQARREYELAQQRIKSVHSNNKIPFLNNISLENRRSFASSLVDGIVTYGRFATSHSWYRASEEAFMTLRGECYDRPWLRSEIPLSAHAEIFAVRLPNLCFLMREKLGKESEYQQDYGDMDWRWAHSLVRNPAESILKMLRDQVVFRESPYERMTAKAVATAKFDFPEVFANLHRFIPPRQA